MTRDIDIDCDICRAPMQPSKAGVIGRLKCGARKRIFECTVCDYRKMIFANGWVQKQIEQENAERDSRNASNPVKY